VAAHFRANWLSLQRGKAGHHLTAVSTTWWFDILAPPIRPKLHSEKGSRTSHSTHDCSEQPLNSLDFLSTCTTLTAQTASYIIFSSVSQTSSMLSFGLG